MRIPRHRARVTVDALAAAVLCAAIAVLVVAASAVIVAASGRADDARRALRFSFVGLEHSPGEVVRVALQNARLAAGTLVCAASRPRLPVRLRLALDLGLAVLVALNAALVGVALGAYGSRLAHSIALHAPLELAALSLAGGAYLCARKQPPSLSSLAGIGAVCALLLVAAAALETYTSPGPVR